MAIAKHRPDFVLMDIHLANATDGVAAAAAGPVGFIAKPYTKETVATALSHLGCDGAALRRGQRHGVGAGAAR